MFILDPNITDLKVREKNIVKILFSMNVHQVATPEMMLEDAQSYVLFFRESKAKYSAYIALHLKTTNRSLYYSYFSNPFPEDQLDTAEEEALIFVEGLGAMIDEVDFNNMSDSAQDRWLDEQELFSEAPPTTVVEPVAAAPAAPQPEVQPVPVPVPEPVQPVATAPAAPQPVVQPAPIPMPEPVQPVATATQQPVVPVIPFVQPVLTPIPAQQETPKPVPTQPRPVPLETEASQPVQSKPQKSAAQQQQDIMQQAIKVSIAKTAKKTTPKEPQMAANVVSRDREALVRLLASF